MLPSIDAAWSDEGLLVHRARVPFGTHSLTGAFPRYCGGPAISPVWFSGSESRFRVTNGEQ